MTAPFATSGTTHRAARTTPRVGGVVTMIIAAGLLAVTALAGCGSSGGTHVTTTPAVVQSTPPDSGGTMFDEADFTETNGGGTMFDEYGYFMHDGQMLPLGPDNPVVFDSKDGVVTVTFVSVGTFRVTLEHLTAEVRVVGDGVAITPKGVADLYTITMTGKDGPTTLPFAMQFFTSGG